MIAPSEKHLEDWIVANCKQVYPNYWSLDRNVYSPMIERVIKRQPRLPNGRPDLLVWSGNSVAVVELKKGPIKPEDIMQCLRYMHDVQDIGFQKHVDTVNGTDVRVRIPSIQDGAIIGYVVGHQSPNDNLMLACIELKVTPIIYDFDGEMYHFSLPVLPQDASREVIQDWTHGAVGDAIWEAALIWDEHYTRREANRQELLKQGGAS